jgi:ATP-dependent Zn protease
MRKGKKRQLQKEFVLKSSAEFTPVKREEIYDSEHIFGQLEPIFDYLVNYRAYHREGISVDGGAILCGVPGMGKTMFARYVATESRARFLNVREFPVKIKNNVHLWQPQDVASLFRLSARWVREHHRPIVLFIDQFDSFLGSNSPDVWNQFELELDGFLERGSGIFLLTTSQTMPNVVMHQCGCDDDDGGVSFGGALFRRGRIGIHIPFIKPDFGQCVKLLTGFLDEHPHEDGIDVDSLVHLLQGPTAADLKYAVSEARQLARREMVKAGAEGEALASATITQSHLVEIFLSKTLDRETGHTMMEKEMYETCVHEMGHYAAARAYGIGARFASVRPGLRSLGITFDHDEAKSTSHEDLRRSIILCCGSWEAEKLCGISENTGKGGDLEMANDFAAELSFNGERKHLKQYGRLLIDRFQEDGSCIQLSDAIKAALEKDLADIIRVEERRARDVLRFFGKKLIVNAARALQKSAHGVLLQKELDALLQPKLSEFHRKHNIVDRIQPTV